MLPMLDDPSPPTLIYINEQSERLKREPTVHKIQLCLNHGYKKNTVVTELMSRGNNGLR